MKLISWNVNGLRSILGKGFRDYLDEEKPDVLCLQEIRCRPDDVEEILSSSYTAHFHSAERAG